MRTPVQLDIDGKQKEALRLLMIRAKTKEEFQRCQCIWMKYVMNMSPAATAVAIGWSSKKVKHLQTRYLNIGEQALIKEPREEASYRK